MEELIRGLVERTSQLLPFTPKSQLSVTSNVKLGDLRQNAASLIKLSKYKVEQVIEGLLHMYTQLQKSYSNYVVSSSPESQTPQQGARAPVQNFAFEGAGDERDIAYEKYIRSKLIIFQLLSKTLTAVIGEEKFDLRFDDDFLAEADELYNREEEEKEREEKEKFQREQQEQQRAQDKQNEQQQAEGATTTEAATTPEEPATPQKVLPTLDSALAGSVLKYMIETLFPPKEAREKVPRTSLKYLAARIIYKLSTLNFDVVFSKIESFFKGMKSDEVDPVIFTLIEYVNFDLTKLSKLIGVLNDAAPKFKKHSFQALAQPLRQAIWNWITNYPNHFIKLCRSKTSLPGNPMMLFEFISTFTSSRTEKKSRQQIMWPVQTMLLLLCPEVLSSVIMAYKQGVTNDNRKKQRKFLENLRKALSTKDKYLSDVSLVCFVDLYKASTYLSKSDLSALRFLFSEVQNDIQERLMNMDYTQVIKPESKITTRLMVDFLVSAYRINSRHVSSYLFPVCFRGSALYKLVLTKAMLKLAQEGAALPWHPTLSESYVFLAKPVRLLFQDLLQEERQLQQMKAEPQSVNPKGTPLKRQPSAVQTSQQSTPLSAESQIFCTETLLNLLAVFYTDPKLVLENTNTTAAAHINDILYLFAGLCNCLSLGDFNNVQIQNQSYRLLQKLFDIKYIERWCPQDVSAGFIELSSSVLTHLSCMLVADKDLQGQNIKTLLELEKELTSSANRFIALHKEKITQENLKSRKRIQSLENAESALLVLLCSSEADIWATAASCFGDLCNQIDILGEKEIKQNTILSNYALYRKISQLVEDVSKGRNQQQKGIRKLLRRVELQTKANLSAFIEVYSRWKAYTNALIQNALLRVENRSGTGSLDAQSTQQGSQSNQTVMGVGGVQLTASNVAATQKVLLAISDSNEQSYERMKTTWKNYTAFLCSMGGVCLQSAEGVFANTTGSNKKKEHTKLTDELMKDLMRLVGSQIFFIREGITQTIGTELSPALYGTLFQNLHSTVATFFGEEGDIKVSEAATQFMDKAIDIVTSILEQAQENGADELLLANFEALVQSFVKYCSTLVLGTETVGIKCKVCILIFFMMHRKEYISFLNEVEFKFTCLRQIVEWTSDFALKSQGTATETSEAAQIGDTNTLFRDLDPLCMRAISSLLKDLSLVKIKRDPKISSKEKDEINKREFFKYFAFLSRYLQKSKADTSSSPQLKQLRDFTILALGNLLESNINYGLEQFMKMAYIEDQETRSAFLHVLTKIVKQGIKLDEEESDQGQLRKYDKLLNFLTASAKNAAGEEYLLNQEVIFSAMATAALSEQDLMCKALVKLFTDRRKEVLLLKAAIDVEVASASSLTTLLRANSFASKMLTAYCNLIGKDYLHATLASMINELCQNPGQFEVDETKVKAYENLQQNIENLKGTAKLFLDCVLLSVSECPLQLRNIFNYIAHKVDLKFPHVEKAEPVAQAQSSEEEEVIHQAPRYVAVGGIFFLRYLNPAIAAPHAFGLMLSPPSKDAMRCLLLVTKILQNVSNGVKYQKKETFMKPFESFVEDNLAITREFFDKLINVGSGDATEAEVEVLDEEVKEELLITIHRVLFENSEKLVQKFQSRAAASATNTSKRNSAQNDQLLFEAVQSLLLELGKPPEKEIKEAGAKDPGKEFVNSHFTDFTMRVKEEIDKQKIDMSKIEDKKIFYKGGNSKAGRPVLYFVAKHYGDHVHTNEDHDLVLYHILMTMKSVFAKPYEILLDSTEFKEEHTLNWTHFVNFLKYLPPGAKKNVARVIVFNANSYLKDICKPFNQLKGFSRKASKKLEFASSLKELSEIIDEKNIDLPESIAAFEKDVQNIINQAWLVQPGGTLRACTVKISNKKLCIITKNESILGHSDGKKVDFIDLPSISKVKIEKHAQIHALEHVTIMYDYPQKTIMIKTDINEQLMMTIKASIARHVSEYRMASLQPTAGTGDTIRQQDIPGSVLNMCFLNLESKFPKTRSAAYNLLAALAEQFDFPVTLLETQNMCVPHNTGDLVVALSEQVAGAKPFMTPQFLREALRGFNKVSLPYKYLCLRYIKPWIKNLSANYMECAKEQDQEQIRKIQEWFSDLVKSTTECGDIYPALLSEVWGEISKDPALVEISMECLMKEAVEAGIDNKNQKSDILTDLVVTLASHNSSDLVVKIIVDACRKVFDEEVKNVEQPLEQNPPWLKIIIYCRFLLSLSFQDRINVTHNVPVLFHLIILMIGRGSTFVRATTHALTLNIIHSLATALEFEKEEKKIMQGYLTRLTNPEFKRIFMGNSSVTIDPFIAMNLKEGKEKTKIEPTTMWDLETIAHFFLEVISTCGKAAQNLKHRWHQEWVTTCLSDAVKLNSILLPRLLAVYGVIAPPTDIPNTLSFVMQCLTTSFADYAPYNAVGSFVDLPVASLLCLGQFCYKMSSDDIILQKLLIIPLILLAASDQVLFPAVVHLLNCVLMAISNSKSFVENCGGSLEEYFNKYCRDIEGEEYISKLEKLIAINFKTNYSFAMSSLLLKGLTVRETREKTAQMCTSLVRLHTTSQQFLQNSAKGEKHFSDILGYLASLVPGGFIDLVSNSLSLNSSAEAEKVPSTPFDVGATQVVEVTTPENAEASTTTSAEVVVPSSPASEPVTPLSRGESFRFPVATPMKSSQKPVGADSVLYLEPTYSNSHSPLLFVRFLLTIVQNVEMDSDKVGIYHVLQQAFAKIPSVFIPVYGDVMPRVINVFSTASTTRIAEVSLSLINTMMATAPESAMIAKNEDGLKDVQFTGLARAGSFKAAAEKQRDCLQLVLEFIKKVSTGLPEVKLPTEVPLRPVSSSTESSEKSALSKKKQDVEPVKTSSEKKPVAKSQTTEKP